MKASPPIDWREFDRLIEGACDQTLSSDDCAQLNRWLTDEPEACGRYVAQLAFHGNLAWSMMTTKRFSVAELQRYVGAEQSVFVTGLDETVTTLPDLSVMNFVGAIGEATDKHFAPSMPIAYLISAVVIGLAMLVGSLTPTSRSGPAVSPRQPESELAVASEPEVQFVGRITGLVDCQWDDPATRPFENAYVPLGRRYDLTAGLMEITYETGAKVILHGPCSYKVESTSSGYLAIGKVTARLEAKAETSSGVSERNNGLPFGKRHSQTAHRPTPSSSVFSVRTPTAIVTDLGTEFAVEVEKSGASRAHVFQGHVEIQLTPGTRGAAASPIRLGANESARVDLSKASEVRIIREPMPTQTFARQLPKRVRIKLSNTGHDLKENDPDPNWQLVKRSDDPRLLPQSAVVVNAYSKDFLRNVPASSQWISVAGGLSFQPENVTFTFRTTFDLTGKAPNTAMLRGRFIADNHVGAIRLNGRELVVPEHGFDRPFLVFHEFVATDGFVAGINVLEIDVINGGSGIPSKNNRSPIACRVELEGSVLPDWRATHGSAGDKQRPDR